MPTGVLWVDAGLLGILGLLVGSFLNVVIYRLPKMLERQWAAECAEFSGSPATEQPAFNLLTPRSRCPHCQHPIGWHQNIPVLSFVIQGGRCSNCNKPIGIRYPMVELATGALFLYCGLTYGATASALAWCAFSAALLSLALIDWDTTLLPDDITLPLLWLGLVAALMRWTTIPIQSSLWGAIAGYLSLWSIYWVFKLVTGKEGMGYGDFKLFAALGAWFGWQALIPMILLASVIGAVVGIAMKLRSSLRDGGYVPFGPFLAGGGFAAMLLGPQVLMGAIGL